MQRGRFIFVAALALAAISAQAATTPVTLVNTDFTLQDPSRPPTAWQTNGTAGLELNAAATGTNPAVTLALTHNLNSETGAAWTILKARVPSFSMYVDANLDFENGTDPGKNGAGCPADGFAMAFANTSATALGGGGSNLGLFGNEEAIPRFIALEVNTWYKNAAEDLSTDTCSTGKEVSFSVANANTDTGIGRSESQAADDPAKGGVNIGNVTAPVKIMNGGWFRYQWNVDATARTMQLYITGLEDSNKATQ